LPSLAIANPSVIRNAAQLDEPQLDNAKLAASLLTVVSPVALRAARKRPGLQVGSDHFPK
jgi:hypothetical protein